MLANYLSDVVLYSKDYFKTVWVNDLYVADFNWAIRCIFNNEHTFIAGFDVDSSVSIFMNV